MTSPNLAAPLPGLGRRRAQESVEAATRYADDLDANEDAVPRGLRVEEERVRTMVATSRRRLGTARTKGPPDTQKNA